LIAVALFVAAVYVPHPEGIWYFGPGARWLVAIDHGGLTIGPSAYRPVVDGMVQDTVSLGWVPLLVAKLVVIALPVWFVWRYALRRRRRGETADG